MSLFPDTHCELFRLLLVCRLVQRRRLHGHGKKETNENGASLFFFSPNALALLVSVAATDQLFSLMEANGRAMAAKESIFFKILV